MRYLLYEYITEQSPKRSSAKEVISRVVDRISVFWMIAGIKIIIKWNAEKKLETSYNTWIALRKSQHRTNDPGG